MRLPTVHIVTQWSGSGGTEAYLSGQLASFSALTLHNDLALRSLYAAENGIYERCGTRGRSPLCAHTLTYNLTLLFAVEGEG